MTEVNVDIDGLQGCAGSLRSSTASLDEAISAAQSSMGLSVEAFGLISGAIFTPPVLGLLAVQTTAMQAAKVLVDVMAERVEACCNDYRDADERSAEEYRRIDPMPRWRPLGDGETVSV